jgi:hypothetical protein
MSMLPSFIRRLVATALPITAIILFFGEACPATAQGQEASSTGAANVTSDPPTDGTQAGQGTEPEAAQKNDETHASFDAERKSSNSANDPTEPRLTVEYWNYYAPSLNNLNGGAENGEGRLLIPFKIDGLQQIFHIDPPIVTNPTAQTGPRTGLGDTQIYNFTLFKRDIGLYEHDPITFGIGPLVAVPTSTNTNFGTNTLQVGAAGVIIAPQSWGLLGVLGTYQHTVSGASSQLTTVQPNIYFNLHGGWYLRSSAIMRFDSGTHTTTIPVGLGAGKVIQLSGGYTLNAYVEAQPSVYRSGTGAPNFQIFTGIQLQFPP